MKRSKFPISKPFHFLNQKCFSQIKTDYESNNPSLEYKYENSGLVKYYIQPNKKPLEEYDDVIDYPNMQSTIMANCLIKKINSENYSKNGKINPLFEEDQISFTQFPISNSSEKYSNFTFLLKPQCNISNPNQSSSTKF